MGGILCEGRGEGRGKSMVTVSANTRWTAVRVVSCTSDEGNSGSSSSSNVGVVRIDLAVKEAGGG